MNSQQREQLLDSAELLFLGRDGIYVTLDQLSKQSQVPEVDIKKEFPNEALVCSAWLSRTDERSEKIHEAILLENKPAIEKVDDYFFSLVNYMQEHQYRGCVFSHVATGLGDSEKEKPVVDVIVEHKQKLHQFFYALANDLTNENSTVLGDSLFLLYSGATTESKNTRSLTPVQAARESARLLCMAYS